MRFLSFFVCFTFLTASLKADSDLGGRVVRLSLNQDQPPVIKLGVHGITTIEFPKKIEALDGFGFSANPLPEGPDLFQISFNKGTNFISLKAVKPRVEANLTVVLDGKVYALLCKETEDPSFVVIFEEQSGKKLEDSQPKRTVSTARLLGFLDKVKGFQALKVSAPEIFEGMEISEPNTSTGVPGLAVNIRRIVRDNALDSVGFDLQLSNKSDKDFLYDPESFAVRVGDEVYQQSVSDAGGMVPAGKTQPAYFVVTGSAGGGRNDLSVSNKFDVVLRPVKGEMDPQRKVSAEWQEPPNQLVTNANETELPLPQKDGDTSNKPAPTSKPQSEHRSKSRGHKATPRLATASPTPSAIKK